MTYHETMEWVLPAYVIAMAAGWGWRTGNNGPIDTGPDAVLRAVLGIVLFVGVLLIWRAVS